jgi:hypothetical protein
MVGVVFRMSPEALRLGLTNVCTEVIHPSIRSYIHPSVHPSVRTSINPSVRS